MAELQTLSAACQLVGIAKDTARFINKVAKARQEAVTLSKDVERLNRLLKSITKLLESRENEGRCETPAPAEKSAESAELTIRESLDECRKCLGVINAELEPLARIPQGQINAARRLKWVFTDNFIKTQEKHIERHFQSLSLSLLLLQCSTNQTEQRKTQRLLNKLIREVQRPETELQSSDPDSSLVRQRLVEVSSDVIAEHPSIESGEVNENEDEDIARDMRRGDDVSEDEDISALDIALQIAVKHDQENIIRELRETGADFSRQDEDNYTLLHFAVLKNAERSLIALLDTEPGQPSVWLNAQSKQGLTALMLTTKIANSVKSVALARTLISSGCDVNIQDSQNRSAICFAIDGTPNTERQDLVKLLLASHADPEPAFKCDEKQAKRYPELQECYDALQQNGD